MVSRSVTNSRREPIRGCRFERGNTAARRNNRRDIMGSAARRVNRISVFGYRSPLLPHVLSIVFKLWRSQSSCEYSG